MSNDLPKGWNDIIGLEVNFLLCDIQQIKEKFGELRIYWKPNAVATETFRAAMESKWAFQCSASCVVCGDSATEFQRTGWIGPRCDEHYEN